MVRSRNMKVNSHSHIFGVFCELFGKGRPRLLDSFESVFFFEGIYQKKDDLEGVLTDLQVVHLSGVLSK
ncbi:MAG: hypothetical protein COR54_02340 [Elusimicrobia bacterium CG22_combo_CG10-13_8_21_14_all_63_91]|nr:MAG: hypothetical protein COR54_02340 [Elusimicrobia bacterium CG22_combo_CG10-13_8_21_14_all_63_91]PJA14723.1 MAG: hypothetical protein COX66_11965 [Elusimicrobia bacterium CG_4_10_14_0_2_um_filter_63_34]